MIALTAGRGADPTPVRLKGHYRRHWRTELPGKEAMENIVESFVKLIGKQRELLSLADDSDDEGTVAPMSDYIFRQTAAFNGGTSRCRNHFSVTTFRVNQCDRMSVLARGIFTQSGTCQPSSRSAARLPKRSAMASP